MILEINYIYKFNNIYKFFNGTDSCTIVLKSIDDNFNKFHQIFDEVVSIKVADGDEVITNKNKYKLKDIDINIIEGTTTIRLHV